MKVVKVAQSEITRIDVSFTPEEYALINLLVGKTCGEGKWMTYLHHMYAEMRHSREAVFKQIGIDNLPPFETFAHLKYRHSDCHDS